MIVGGLARGDERAAAVGGLGDEHASGHAGDDSIAAGGIVGQRGGAQRLFADKRAARGGLGGKTGGFWRVGATHAAAQGRERTATPKREGGATGDPCDGSKYLGRGGARDWGAACRIDQAPGEDRADSFRQGEL